MANLRVSLRRKGASNFETGDKFLPETDWAFILNKPATFVPDPHNHTIAQVTGLQGVLDGKAASTHSHPISQVTGLQTDLDGKLSSGYLASRTQNNPDSSDDVGVKVEYLASGANNKPSGTDHALITYSFSNQWSVQLAGDWRTKDLYIRSQENGAWKTWSKFWHDGNLTNLNQLTNGPSYITASQARSNTWVPSWSEVTSKPSWIGTNKPTYDLGEISETTTYKRVTENEKIAWNFKADITDIEVKISAYDADITPIINGKLSSSLKGSANGLAELDANGKVPSAQLPSFVDDVLEFTNLASFPTTGEGGKIYIDLATNKTYRWGGSAYVVISETISLGETSSTAYRGDRGKIAYDHSQVAHAPSNAQKNSDITQAEIEAKLQGTITSHTHSQYLLATGKAADSDKLDGLDLNSTTRNNEVNKVMRTDASGYANFGWINTTSGNTTSTVTDVYVNTNDGYIRKKTLALFKTELGSMPASNVKSWAIDGSGIIPSVTDANDIVEVGFYHQYNLSNAPTTGWYFYIVNRHDASWISQEAISFGSGNTANRKYIRVKAGGTWTAWKEIADKDWVTANTRSNTWVPSWSEVTGLQAQLNDRAPLVHVQGWDTISGKPSWITSTKPAYEGMGISRTVSADNTYDLLSTDLNKLIIVNAPSGCMFQITTAFNNAAAVGAEVQFFNKSGAAAELYSTASGVSILSEGNKIGFSGFKTMVAIKKISSTEWIMVGALT